MNNTVSSFILSAGLGLIIPTLSFLPQQINAQAAKKPNTIIENGVYYTDDQIFALHEITETNSKSEEESGNLQNLKTLKKTLNLNDDVIISLIKSFMSRHRSKDPLDLQLQDLAKAHQGLLQRLKKNIEDTKNHSPKDSSIENWQLVLEQVTYGKYFEASFLLDDLANKHDHFYAYAKFEKANLHLLRYQYEEALIEFSNAHQHLLDNKSQDLEQQILYLISMGSARIDYGFRVQSSSFIKEGIKNLETALSMTHQEAHSTHWTHIKQLIGKGYSNLQWFENDSKQIVKHLAITIEATKQALAAPHQNKMINNRVEMQYQLANSLRQLARTQHIYQVKNPDPITLLQEATTSYRDALAGNIKSKSPLEWANIQLDFGLTLYYLGEMESSESYLRASVDACRNALTIFTEDDFIWKWAETESLIAENYYILGKNSKDISLLQSALDITLRTSEFYDDRGILERNIIQAIKGLKEEQPLSD